NPCHEPVAPPRNRHDVVVLRAALAEQLAQVRYVRREVALLNDSLAPDPLHQLVLVQHLSAPLDQRQKSVELLREQLDRLAVAQQEVLLRVQTKGAELVNAVV